MVIIYQTEYNQKIKDFIVTGQFNQLVKDPTSIFQKSLKICVKKLKCTISDYQRHQLININPKAPNLKGLIKLHNQDLPIRRIVNWKNAPLYQTAKLFKKH
jgi:hypothetical protein